MTTRFFPFIQRFMVYSTILIICLGIYALILITVLFTFA
mgnify:CR=1 FL=1